MDDQEQHSNTMLMEYYEEELKLLEYWLINLRIEKDYITAAYIKKVKYLKFFIN